MTDHHQDDATPEEKADERDEGRKPAWVKPEIRASGSFDLQALACPPGSQRYGPPFCSGGVS